MQLQKGIAGILLIICMLPIVSCSKAPDVEQNPTKPLLLKLESVDIHKVVLARPFTKREANQTSEYKVAYLVMLAFEHPKSWGPKIDLFIGDYRVQEYGGWSQGIYIKFYKPELLMKLNGQELRYRYIEETIRNFERKLNVPDLNKLNIEKEFDVVRKVGNVSTPLA